jgi:hypothetical protein
MGLTLSGSRYTSTQQVGWQRWEMQSEGGKEGNERHSENKGRENSQWAERIMTFALLLCSVSLFGCFGCLVDACVVARC